MENPSRAQKRADGKAGGKKSPSRRLSYESADSYESGNERDTKQNRQHAGEPKTTGKQKDPVVRSQAKRSNHDDQFGIGRLIVQAQESTPRDFISDNERDLDTVFSPYTESSSLAELDPNTEQDILRALSAAHNDYLADVNNVYLANEVYLNSDLYTAEDREAVQRIKDFIGNLPPEVEWLVERTELDWRFHRHAGVMRACIERLTDAFLEAQHVNRTVALRWIALALNVPFPAEAEQIDHGPSVILQKAWIDVGFRRQLYGVHHSLLNEDIFQSQSARESMARLVKAPERHVVLAALGKGSHQNNVHRLLVSDEASCGAAWLLARIQLALETTELPPKEVAWLYTSVNPTVAERLRLKDLKKAKSNVKEQIEPEIRHAAAFKAVFADLVLVERRRALGSLENLSASELQSDIRDLLISAAGEAELRDQLVALHKGLAQTRRPLSRAVSENDVERIRLIANKWLVSPAAVIATAYPAIDASRLAEELELVPKKERESTSRSNAPALEGTTRSHALLSENERAFDLIKDLNWISPYEIPDPLFNFRKFADIATLGDNAYRIVGRTTSSSGWGKLVDGPRSPAHYFVIESRTDPRIKHALRAELLFDSALHSPRRFDPIAPEGEDISILPVHTHNGKGGLVIRTSPRASSSEPQVANEAPRAELPVARNHGVLKAIVSGDSQDVVKFFGEYRVQLLGNFPRLRELTKKHRRTVIGAIAQDLQELPGAVAGEKLASSQASKLAEEFVLRSATTRILQLAIKDRDVSANPGNLRLHLMNPNEIRRFTEVANQTLFGATELFSALVRQERSADCKRLLDGVPERPLDDGAVRVRNFPVTPGATIRPFYQSITALFRTVPHGSMKKYEQYEISGKTAFGEAILTSGRKEIVVPAEAFFHQSRVTGMDVEPLESGTSRAVVRKMTNGDFFLHTPTARRDLMDLRERGRIVLEKLDSYEGKIAAYHTWHLLGRIRLDMRATNLHSKPELQVAGKVRVSKREYIVLQDPKNPERAEAYSVKYVLHALARTARLDEASQQIETGDRVRFLPDRKGRSHLVFADDPAIEAGDHTFRITVSQAKDRIAQNDGRNGIVEIIQRTLDEGDVADAATLYKAFSESYSEQTGKQISSSTVKRFIQQCLLLQNVPHDAASKIAKRLVALGEAQTAIGNGATPADYKRVNGEYLRAAQKNAAFKLADSLPEAELPAGLHAWPTPKVPSKTPPCVIGKILGKYRNGVVIEFKPNPGGRAEHQVVPIHYLVMQRILHCPTGKFECGAELRFAQTKTTLSSRSAIIVAGWKSPTSEVNRVSRKT